MEDEHFKQEGLVIIPPDLMEYAIREGLALRKTASQELQQNQAASKKAKVMVPESVKGWNNVSNEQRQSVVEATDDAPRGRQHRRWSVADPSVAEVYRTFAPPQKKKTSPRQKALLRNSSLHQRQTLANRMETIMEETARKAAAALNRRASIAPMGFPRRPSIGSGAEAVDPAHYFKLSQIAMQWQKRHVKQPVESADTDHRNEESDVSDDDLSFDSADSLRFSSHFSPQAQYALLMCYEDRLRRMFAKDGQRLPPRTKTPTNKRLAPNLTGSLPPLSSGRESSMSTVTSYSVDLEEKRRRITQRLLKAQQMLDSLHDANDSSNHENTQKKSDAHVTVQGLRRWSLNWSKEFDFEPETDRQLHQVEQARTVKLANSLRLEQARNESRKEM